MICLHRQQKKEKILGMKLGNEVSQAKGTKKNEKSTDVFLFSI
jgi:hypothetical protein